MQLDDLEARCLAEVTESMRRVPEEVARLLMQRPAEWRGDDEVPARTQKAGAFNESLPRPLEVLENLGEQDGVHGGVLERDVVGVADDIHACEAVQRFGLVGSDVLIDMWGEGPEPRLGSAADVDESAACVSAGRVCQGRRELLVQNPIAWGLVGMAGVSTPASWRAFPPTCASVPDVAPLQSQAPVRILEPRPSTAGERLPTSPKEGSNGPRRSCQDGS